MYLRGNEDFNKRCCFRTRETVICQVGLSSLTSCYVQWFGMYFTRSYSKGLAICFFREKDNVQSGSKSQEKVRVSRS